MDIQYFRRISLQRAHSYSHSFHQPTLLLQTLSQFHQHRRATLFILPSFRSTRFLPRKSNFNIHASRLAFGFVLTSKGNIAMAGAAAAPLRQEGDERRSTRCFDSKQPLPVMEEKAIGCSPFFEHRDTFTCNGMAFLNGNC